MTNKYAGRCDIQLVEMAPQNIIALKRVNEAVLPVRYSTEFYHNVAMWYRELSRLAYFNDVIVGGILCRVDVRDGVKKLGVMTLGVLSPYRRFGIGRMLLCYAITIAEGDPDIETVCLNVQTSNTSAQEFYKRYGFEIVKSRIDYYDEDIQPRDAFYMELPLKRAETATETFS